MKNHGTTISQITGIYAEFQAAIMEALPRDIDQDVALGWTKNGKVLTRVLRETLVPSSTPITATTYHLTVNYERSVEDMVRAGRYNHINSDITSKHFPTKRKGVAEVEVELIHFNWGVCVWTDETLRELDRMGYRPAELHELLAFGEKYPEIQLKFPVAAIGSVWRGGSGGYYAPHLWKNDLDLERALIISLIEDGWSKNCRFAAARK